MKPIVVISHERSGTHVCINLIALNLGLKSPDIINLGGACDPILDEQVHSFCEHQDVIRKSHHQVQAFNNIDVLLGHYSVIYVVRECPAVMISCWHYFNGNGATGFPHCATFDEFLNMDPSQFAFDSHYSVIPSHSMPRRWKEHTSGWMDYDERGVLVVQFKDLITDPQSSLELISSYVQRPMPKQLTIPKPGFNCVMFRCGRLNEWKTEMTVDQMERIMAEIQC